MDARTDLPLRLQAYAGWLADRGLAGPVVRRRAQGSAGVLFLSGEPLTGEEDALLDKIAAAMGVAERSSRATLAAGELSGHIAERAPVVVVLLGEEALRHALGAEATHQQVAGRLLAIEAHPEQRFLATFHPRELLLHPASKRQAWAELQLAAAAVTGGA